MAEVEIYNGSTLIGTIKKVLDCSINRRLDGECSMSLTTLINYSDFLDWGYTAKVGDLIFYITKLERKVSSDLYIHSISCEHISFLLNNDDYKLQGFSFTGTPADCLAEILSDTPFTTGTVQPTATVTFNITGECNRRDLLMQLVAKSGGEITYNGYTIGIATHVGNSARRSLTGSGFLTEMGYSYDTREGEQSYSAELCKKGTFGIGDEVSLIFAPLKINTNTRIVGITWNPYKDEGASLTLGKYEPTINDTIQKDSDRITQIEESGGGGGGWTVEAVDTLPASPESNTLYLIKN